MEGDFRAISVAVVPEFVCEPLIQKGIEVWNFASLFCSFPWSAGYSISQKLCTRVRTCS